GRAALPRLGRSGAVVVAATVALVAWTGLTVAWSIVPDRSWDAFDKTVAYAAFLGLGVVLGGVAGRAGARLGASLLAVVTALALARERVEGGLLLAAVGVPAALVGGWALTRHGLVDDGASHAARVSDGAVFGGIALVGAAIVVVLVSVGSRRRLGDDARSRVG